MRTIIIFISILLTNILQASSSTYSALGMPIHENVEVKINKNDFHVSHIKRGFIRRVIKKIKQVVHYLKSSSSILGNGNEMLRNFSIVFFILTLLCIGILRIYKHNGEWWNTYLHLLLIFGFYSFLVLTVLSVIVWITYSAINLINKTDDTDKRPKTKNSNKGNKGSKLHL